MKIATTSMIVALEGALTIETASGLAKRLRDALTGPGNLTLDLSAVTDLDLPALQLFYAAAKSAAKQGKRLAFSGTVQAAACKRLPVAGFLTEIPVSGEQLQKLLPDFPAA